MEHELYFVQTSSGYRISLKFKILLGCHTISTFQFAVVDTLQLSLKGNFWQIFFLLHSWSGPTDLLTSYTDVEK